MARLISSAVALVTLVHGSVAYGAIYVVAPTGDDTAAGTEAAPFRTIGHAASLMVAGDMCRVRAGTYREQVTPRNSGTADHPLVFEAFAGERPIVSGTEPVTGTWSTEPDRTRSIAVARVVRQLFAGGKLLVEARWPNVDGDVLTHWATATATAGTSTTLTASSLPAGDWTGALLHVVPGAAWTAYTRRIASYDAATHTVTFDRAIDEVAELVPSAGDSFYVFGTRRALDAPGEWFFDERTHRLSMVPPVGADPAALGVEAKARDYAFDLSGRDHVVIRGFDVFAAAIRLENSRGSVVDGCTLSYPSVLRELDGYRSSNPAPMMSGSDNAWINGRIEHAAADGLLVRGDHQRVIDNEFSDVAFSGGNFGGIETTSATDVEVRNNTVRSSGRYGIMFNATSKSSFTYNRVDEVCLLTLDCGNLEAWNTDGQGTVIAYNDLSGNRAYLGFGIYLDDSSRNFVVHHNLVHGVSFGAVHIKAANDLYSNTFAPEPKRGEPGEAIVVSESLNHRGPVDLAHSKIIDNLLRADTMIRVRLGQSGITDYAYYETSIPAHATWSPAKLRFADFRQPGWGKPARFTQNALDQVLFDVAGQGHYEIGIDNLRRLPSGALLDDLEDGNQVNPFGGGWGADAGNGSTATISIVGPGASSSRFAAVAFGNTAAGGWSQLRMAFSAGRATDFTRDDGIAFDCRVRVDRTYGTPPTVAVTVANADCPVDARYVPTTACAIDRGQLVAGITDGYVGRAPDIGAFEVGAPPWTAGAHAEAPASTVAATPRAGLGREPPKQPNPNCACRSVEAPMPGPGRRFALALAAFSVLARRRGVGTRARARQPR